MTEQEYYQKQNECEDKCYVDASVVDASATELPCVKCPFCMKIVTAILTPTQISCPECRVAVSR